jgi:rod shape-determining protein MreB and related proteins
MLGRMVIGVDLGTASVLVYVRKKGIVLREPSVVALDQSSRRIVAIGNPAEQMLGRTPQGLVAVRPMRDGVIADYEATEAMLRHFISRACGKYSFFKPIVIICVPARVTEVEKRAVVDAAISAGARKALLIEEPLAAAIGAGIDVEAPRGCMIVDIGGGTTDVAVMSLGGIAVCDSIRVAGNRMDEAIIRAVRKNHKLLIGERTAETVKISIGAACPQDEGRQMEIRGRDLVDGMPRSVVVTSEEVREALDEPVSMIVDTVRAVLEKAPPELAADLIDRGITMTGGGSMLRGFDTRLAQSTGMQVKVAEDPICCVAIGTGTVDALKLAS